MTYSQFREGDIIEISTDEEGLRGAWFKGTVINVPPKRGAKSQQTVLVEYEALLSDVDRSKPLRESIDIVQIRPIPPRETSRVFEVSEEVDAFHNDGWWEGIITEVLEGPKYSVYFRTSRDQITFTADKLRLHREWVGGGWVPPLENQTEFSTVADATSSKGKDGNLGKGLEEENFKEGSAVEVSSDEDGFRGAWFAATVVKVIGKNKFLVQYRDLTADDGTSLCEEEVDSLHIRPCPPQIVLVGQFKLYEEVDALYNDGWWVGIISKVLGGARYLVYFKDTSEEIEFQESQLRPHQDWINRKWVVASKALKFSD